MACGCSMDAKFANSVATFAAKFCNELKKDTSVVSSPLSAEFVLALLTLGTTEPAHSELCSALGLPNDDAIRSAFTVVSAKLKDLKGVTLNVANRVYIKDGPYDIEPRLANDAKTVFDAGIEITNFDDGASASRLINSWVENKTNKRIKDLFSSDSFNQDTRMVLVNAIYFKGDWKSKFDPSHTAELDFHVDSKTTIKVPMMFQKADFKYGVNDDLGAQILKLPYKGDGASMVIILPNEIDGLNNVMNKIANGFDLLGAIENTFETKLQVFIPKFRIETEIDLKTVLPKLGIKSIFNSSRSGLDNLLTPKEPLTISKAVQKAFIEVNEEGAEAAAATAMGMMMMCAIIEPPPQQFMADRPFLTAILVQDVAFFMAAYHGN